MEQTTKKRGRKKLDIKNKPLTMFFSPEFIEKQGGAKELRKKIKSLIQTLGLVLVALACGLGDNIF